MVVLAVETSSTRGSVALIKNQTSDELFWDRAESHSEILTLQTNDLLKKHSLKLSDVDYFATGIGPGSFTGIRVAVNFCKTCAYVQKKPVIIANSLELIASEKLAQYEKVAVALVAFRNLIYTASYVRGENGIPKEIDPPKALTMEEFIAKNHAGFALCGDLALKYPKLLQLKSVSSFSDVLLPSAKSFRFFMPKQLDQSHVLPWGQVVPLYIRASEAEEKLRKSLSKPT